MGLLTFGFETKIYEDTEDDDFEFLTVYLPYLRNHFLEWDYNIRGIPADYEQLKSDRYFLTSLKLNITNGKATLGELEKATINISEILPVLEEAILAYN